MDYIGYVLERARARAAAFTTSCTELALGSSDEDFIRYVFSTCASSRGGSLPHIFGNYVYSIAHVYTLFEVYVLAVARARAAQEKGPRAGFCLT